MAALVHGPLITERGSIEESNGAIKRLVCHYEIKQTAAGTISAKMKEAYAAMDTAGIIFGGILTDFPDLMITDRNISLMPGSTSTWLCEVTLMNYGDLEGQGVFSCSSSLTSTTSYTNYYGLPITVSYTFPADYIPNPDWATKTLTQGVAVNVMTPVYELVATKLISCSKPTLYCDEWEAKLNATTWRGILGGNAMCSNVSYKFVRKHKAGDAAGDKYLFQFSFQAKRDGWQPKVQFVDPNTGNPPANLVYGVGYGWVYYYPSKEFNILFPGGS